MAAPDIVREWTIALGVLTGGTMSPADAEMKLRAYVPLLLDRFPVAAFTQDSLEHVAARCKWFPSYAEIVEHLAPWWRDHRPMPPALPPPDLPPPRPEPTDAERAYVADRVREAIAALHSPASDPRDDRPGFGPVHLSPGVLDAINPLPNGRKRSAPPP